MTVGVVTLSLASALGKAPLIVCATSGAVLSGTPGEIRTRDSHLSRVPLYEAVLAACGRWRLPLSYRGVNYGQRIGPSKLIRWPFPFNALLDSAYLFVPRSDLDPAICEEWHTHILIHTQHIRDSFCFVLLRESGR